MYNISVEKGGGYVNYFIMWIIIGVITLVLDIATSTLLFVWFTLGSLGAITALMLEASFVVQVLVFLVVSAIGFAAGYPLAKKIIKRDVKKLSTVEEGYLGRELIVDEEIIEKSMIKIDGIYWTIKNEGEMIKKGDKVIVTGISGNKIIIRKSYL